MSGKVEYVRNQSVKSADFPFKIQSLSTQSVDDFNLSNNMQSNPKKNRHRWLIVTSIVIALLVAILVIILTTIFVIRAKNRATLSIINSTVVLPIQNIGHNMSDKNQNKQISIRGLLTIDTAVQSKMCESNETIEDCVLLHNTKIIMTALMLASSTNDSVIPSSSTNRTGDCKSIQIRPNQLSQIFEPVTLKTVYTLSGVPLLSSIGDSIQSNASSSSIQTRTQIDARAGQNKWSLPINYYIRRTTGLTRSMIANIHTAISNWSNNTCITFNELSTITSTTNPAYIDFQRDDVYGCSSSVGYDPTDPTTVILLAEYCGSIIPSVMHEIGHALGYIHTQARTDRDSFVQIITKNIDKDYLGNFWKWSYGTLNFSDVAFPYDFGSIMHYDAFAFSTNNLATIVPYDSRYVRTMGQRERTAFDDYKQINRLYCTRTDCPQMFANNNCQNSGYLDPRTCSRCVCPEGFGGTYCDQPDPMSNCGNTIVNLTPYSSAQYTIQNPAPISTSPSRQYCVFLIRSLSPRKIHLRLNSINTMNVTVCNLTSVLEVKYRLDLGVTGARWCGNDISSSWLNVTAESNTMMVIFRATNYVNVSTATAQAGFQATVFFDAEPMPVLNLTAPSTVSNPTTTTTATTLFTCPASSFRCQLPSQPTCGGCLQYTPCTASGTQQCTQMIYQPQLFNCTQIVNGNAQCQYGLVQTTYVTSCQRNVLLCCPGYQLISFQSQYYCVYNAQATDIAEWSLVL